MPQLTPDNVQNSTPLNLQNNSYLLKVSSLVTIASQKSHWTLAIYTGIPYYVQDENFEWDDDKAAANLRDHRVSFEQAAFAFNDQFAVEWIDEREAYGEERSVLLGMTSGQVLTVVYTERGDRIRIISAWRATRHERDYHYRQNAP